ncbi:hypothetical protein JCM17380_12100 [Desulfosporosinus burensis]
MRVYAKARYGEHGGKPWRGFSAFLVGERELFASPRIADYGGVILMEIFLGLC